jgi:uncharacterized protein with HEPN domain
MHKPDRIRLQHMLDAAREAIASVQGRVRADLDHDRIWALGLVKCIEIIGEAAARVTPEACSQFPQIPGPQIVGMRNRLVHAYFALDLDQVWNAMAQDLSPPDRDHRDYPSARAAARYGIFLTNSPASVGRRL